MLEKLKERRQLLSKEHTELLERYTKTKELLSGIEKRLTMLVGHVSELDFQMESIVREEDANKELDCESNEK